MEIVERKIVVPDNHSFIINELDLTRNRGVMHSHKNIELNFMVNARGKRFVGGSISDFAEGDLVLLGPDLPHCWVIDNKDEEPVALTVHFHENLFHSNIFNVPEFDALYQLLNRAKHGIYFRSIKFDAIKSLLMELKELAGFEAMIHLIRIFRFLSDTEDIQTLANDRINAHTMQLNDDRVNKVYEYIFHHFQDGIKLHDLAELVNLSEGALCSYFKKTTKKSIFTFLKEVKIGYACKLLTSDTGKNVSEVCFESGYNNLANFNRQFKEINHMSPKEYRANLA